jgi:hypothetical protein
VPLAPRLAAARKAKRRILTFGRGRGTIQPGRSGFVKVRLSRKALKRLHKVKKVRVTASTVSGVAAAARSSHVYAIKFASRKKR